MKLNLNPIVQNQIFNVYRMNQSAVQKTGKVWDASAEKGHKDMAFISPQGKRESLIETLMKQKMNIMEQKDSLISSAKKEGKSMESIQSQLEVYEKQLKDIEDQISKAMTKEMEKQAEKKKKDEPKTEQELENERLANVMELSSGLQKAEMAGSVKARVDGEARVLKSEIELDQLHDPSEETSKEMITGKEGQLADLEQKSNELLSDIGEMIGETVEKAEWQSIQPLQDEGSKGALTGVKLSEGKRLDGWEITYVQSEDAVSLANTYQPGGIKVVHTEDRHYLRNTEQYFGVFEQYAKGQISEDEFTAYSAVFGSKIRTTLHTDRSTVGGLNALVNEMKENISKGIANTPDNLKTKLFAGGIEVTWKELMNMQKTGEYIDSFLAAGGSGTYMTYANIGIARAYVHKSGLGLTEDQVKVLSEAVEKKIDRKLENSKLLLDLAAADKQNPMWEGYYIGGTRTQPVASNTKMISEITEAFSKIDPNDKSTYDVAVERFQEIMRPWEETFAGYVARQEPGYASSYVYEKERNSKAGFQAIWNGTY